MSSTAPRESMGRFDAGTRGFRLIWNLVTTVSFDYGISSEGQIFHMDLGYAF